MTAVVHTANGWLALLLFWGGAAVLVISLYFAITPPKCPTHGRGCLENHPRPARGRHRKRRRAGLRML